MTENAPKIDLRFLRGWKEHGCCWVRLGVLVVGVEDHRRSGPFFSERYHKTYVKNGPWNHYWHIGWLCLRWRVGESRRNKSSFAADSSAHPFGG